MFPAVRVAYAKDVNPEPRVYRPGGVTKRDISNKTHQTNVIMKNSNEI